MANRRPLGRMRGIASRVQWCEESYNTFTIRRRRFNGAKTEFEKRIDAIDDPDGGWPFPALTIHAYVSHPRTGELLGAGVIRTRDLYRYIADGKENVHWLIRQTSNADFYAVSWTKLKAHGVAVRFVDYTPRVRFIVPKEDGRPMTHYDILYRYYRGCRCYTYILQNEAPTTLVTSRSATRKVRSRAS